MVRLIIDDFSSIEENLSFFGEEEKSSKFKTFVSINSFRFKYVEVPKNITGDSLYSVTKLSAKYLSNNKVLVYITDEEYVILFNHKTVYFARLSEEFYLEDIIKSILITKHIGTLSLSGDEDVIHYIVSSKHKYAVRAMLEENTRNVSQKVIANSLGDIETLVEPLAKLDDYTSLVSKNLLLLFVVSFSLYTVFFGLSNIEDNLHASKSLSGIKKRVNAQDRLSKKHTRELERVTKEYQNITACISSKDKR